MTDNSFPDLMKSLVASVKFIFPTTKVIRAYSGGIEPEEPHIAIAVIRDTQTGGVYTDTLLNPQGQLSITSNYEALIQFSFIAEDEEIAGSMGKTFVQRLNSPRVREEFRKNKLAKLSNSQIRNVPTQRESTWIQHYNVDVTFVYSVLTYEDAIAIEVVQLEDEIEGAVFTVPPDVVIQ